MKRIKITPKRPLPEPKHIKESITFSPWEWDHFIDELKMRGVEKIDLCVNNAKYLAMLDRADAADSAILVSMEELEAMADGASVEDLGGIVDE